MPAAYPVPNHPWLSVIEGPLYRQELPRAVTDAELATLITEVERITTSMRSPFGWVIDISNVFNASAKQRSMYAAADERMARWDALYCAGTAFCAKGALARGLVTAVQWLSPPAYPFRVFADVRDAERWARQQLVERGVEISRGEAASPPPLARRAH